MTRYIIKYKTIMGIDGLTLDEEVAKIVGYSTNDSIRAHVLEYQNLNKK